MIELEQPSVQLVSSYLDLVGEMRALGETSWAGTIPGTAESPAVFVQRLLRAEHSRDPGRVPVSTFWATVGDVVVGRIALRHWLNESLEEFGGHIGYEVRPSCRRRGIAKEMLRQLLGHHFLSVGLVPPRLHQGLRRPCPALPV